MPTIAEIINERLGRLESVPDSLYTSTSKAERKFIQAFVRSLSKLETKKGNLILSNANLARVDEIAETLKKEVFGGEYAEALKQFAKEFPIQASLANTYFEKTFEDTFKSKETYQALVKQAQRDTLKLLDANAVDSAFITPLKQQLSRSISTGADFGETVQALTNYIQGTPDIDGALLRHVKTVARDGFSVYDRTYGEAIATDIGAEWYVYRGGGSKDTRDFCAERVNKYFHRREIEKMASKDWQGKRKGTDANTIFQYCGGWNCLHSWMPVSKFAVPKSVIERNIENGNYEE